MGNNPENGILCPWKWCRVMSICAVASGAGSISVCGAEPDGRFHPPKAHTLFAPRWEDGFGFSLAPAGDLNGDGIGDLIVGCPERKTSSRDGFVMVFLGSRDGHITSPWKIWRSPSAGTTFGRAVTQVGDLDGDGRSEVAVSMPSFSQQHSSEGQVLFLKPKPVDSESGYSVVHSVRSRLAQSRLGLAMAGGRDLTGDGKPDLAIGLPNLDNSARGSGAVWVVSPTPGNTTLTPVWTYEFPVKNALMGGCVRIDGDANGDGFSDLAVGGRGILVIDAGKGAPCFALVFLGSTNGLPTTPTWTIETPSRNDLRYFGHSLAWIDIDGDGRSELVVGAPGANQSRALPGRIIAYRFSKPDERPTEIWAWSPETPSAATGEALANAGDVNGDGRQDLIVSAANGRFLPDRRGRCFLFLGKEGGFGNTPDFVWDPPEESNHMGYSLCGNLDLNGDGLSDFVIGSPAIRGAEDDVVGRIDIVYGSRTANWRGLRANARREGGFSFSRIESEAPKTPPSPAPAKTNGAPVSP